MTAKFLGFIPYKPPGFAELSLFAREVFGEKMIFSQRRELRTSLVATQIKTQHRSPVWDVRLGDYTLINPIETDIEY